MNKTPIGTYIIIFSNSILPPLILSLVIGGLIVSTNEAGEHLTFIELYFPAVLSGFYLSAAISLLYHLAIRLGWFWPRWWSNLLLIILGYFSIPVVVLLFGFYGVANDAMTKLGKNIFYVFFFFVVGFVFISVLTRKRSKKATLAIGVSTPLPER